MGCFTHVKVVVCICVPAEDASNDSIWYVCTLEPAYSIGIFKHHGIMKSIAYVLIQ